MCEVLHEAERGCVGAVVRGKKRVARAVVCVQQRCIEPWCSAALHAAVYHRLRLRSSKKNCVYNRDRKNHVFPKLFRVNRTAVESSTYPGNGKRARTAETSTKVEQLCKWISIAAATSATIPQDCVLVLQIGKVSQQSPFGGSVKEPSEERGKRNS